MADDGELTNPLFDFAALSGLSPITERIYLFVLRMGHAAASAVAEHFSITPLDASQHLNTLRSLGLLAQRQGDEAEYTPVDPRYSLRAIASRLNDAVLHIRDQIPELAERYDHGTTTTQDSLETRVLGDPEAVAGWYARLQLQANHEFMAFDRPPYLSASMNPLEETVLSRGVEWRAVYTADSFREGDIWDEVARWAAEGEQARVVPTLPIKLAIADRSIPLVSLTLTAETHEILVTESGPLVEALCDLFEFYWERALPVPTSRRLEDVEEAFRSGDGRWKSSTGRGPTKDEQAILALIGAGLTDDVIARQLGVSTRTLRRRSQDLMLELGADNRFQLGLEAGRRGWL